MIKDIGSKKNKDVSESSEKAGFIIFDEICNDSSSAASANDFMSDSIWKKSPGASRLLIRIIFYQILFLSPGRRAQLQINNIYSLKLQTEKPKHRTYLQSVCVLVFIFKKLRQRKKTAARPESAGGWRRPAGRGC